eukprot:gene11226-biopygen21381
MVPSPPTPELGRGAWPARMPPPPTHLDVVLVAETLYLNTQQHHSVGREARATAMLRLQPTTCDLRARKTRA